jgi:flavin-dependent dehydrogenase
MDSNASRQVIVVGALVAGLVAAKRLSDGGLDVLVLEARERLYAGPALDPMKGQPALSYDRFTNFSRTPVSTSSSRLM